jgi:hypothetical protein
MSKQLVVKVAVALAAVSAMTLLQGCEDDAIVIGGAWAPAGFSSVAPPALVPTGTAGASSGAAAVSTGGGTQ